MSWLRRFLNWANPPTAPQIPPMPQYESCSCPACQPSTILNYGHVSELNPSADQLREVVIWNELIQRTPPVNLQEPSRWAH